MLIAIVSICCSCSVIFSSILVIFIDISCISSCNCVRCGVIMSSTWGVIPCIVSSVCSVRLSRLLTIAQTFLNALMTFLLVSVLMFFNALRSFTALL